ncbi:MAG: hypothetical protein KIS73_29785 [Enhydrobacter sp.]|nr:hypothetical protein [Enhydrobacter sp.]
MPDRDRDSIVVGRRTGGGRYVSVGALVVAALVGAYVAMGTPGLHTQVANAPGGHAVDGTVPQRGPATAPAVPARADRKATE